MKKSFFSVIISLCLYTNYYSQEIVKVSEAEKKEIVSNISKFLEDSYVFSNIGNSASTKLLENLKTGKYKNVNDVMQFSEMLTMDLQTITKDKHFIVAFAPNQVESMKNEPKKKAPNEIDPQKLEEGKYYNFGFSELKILDGNVGYLNLKGFFPLNMTKETIASAMNFLSNTNAIIIDLRENQGGSIDMPPYLASYFLPEQKQTLLQMMNRNNEEEDKTETTEKIEGKRLFGKPLYILTGQKTFSAAEAFSYTLKNRNAAILIGENTGGGANPIQPKILNNNFVLGMPTFRPIDPITKSNWEEKGVEPNINISINKAQEIAHITALENIDNKVNNPETKWLVEILKGKYNPLILNEETLKSYTGKYGVRTLSYENNMLMYQKEGQPKIKMIAISNNTFILENTSELKIEITIENKKVTGFKRIFMDGSISFEKRD